MTEEMIAHQADARRYGMNIGSDVTIVTLDRKYIDYMWKHPSGRWCVKGHSGKHPEGFWPSYSTMLEAFTAVRLHHMRARGVILEVA